TASMAPGISGSDTMPLSITLMADASGMFSGKEIAMGMGFKRTARTSLFITWRSRTEGRHRSGESVVPSVETWVLITPAAIKTKITIA
ncbi:hypothetical protein NKJ87_34090, partial [Mesorhizobium sp. M0027]